MKHLYKIMALFLLLAVAGGQCGFAQSYTVRVMSDTTVSICDSSIVWHGETITSSGNYEHLRDTVGDTIYVDSLHLTINTPTSSEETVSECVSYEWHNSLYTTGGDYTWTTTGSNGCDSVVTLHLTIYYPAHSALSETSCGSFTWHSTTYTTSGDYTYSFQDENGCTQVDTLHLTVNPLPTPSIIGDTVICHGQTTTLTATGGLQYQWSLQASKISDSCAVTVSASGEYTVKVTDANECQKVAKTTVKVLPQFLAGSILSDDTVLCEGAHASVTISQESAASGGDNKISYRWKCNNEEIPDSTNNTLNVYVNNLNPGTYLYTREAKDSTCNTGWTVSEGQYTIIIEALPDVHILASADTICHGEEATLVATGGASYRWSTSDTTQQITLAGDTTTTYTVTATSIHNCSASDSLTITVLPTYNVKDTMTICESQLPYVWNGATFTAAGTKDAILPTVNGCDRVVTMTLMVNPTYNVTDTKTICASQLPYEWNGVTFATAGTKTTTLNTVNGCDSMVTMILTVNPTYNVTDTKTICASQLPHEWNGVTFAAAGTKNVTLQSVNYCDSIVAMTLTVNPTYNTPITESICQGQNYNFYGQNLTTAGVYTYTLTTSKGCDSIITLTLTVNPLPTVIISGEGSFCLGDNVTLTAMGASSYTWNNASTNPSITVGNAGTYTVTGTDANGCANTATKTITVNSNYNITVHDTICDGKSYNFFGQNIDYSVGTNTFTDTLYTSKGCDSIITLILTVNPLPTVTIGGDSSFCQGTSTVLRALGESTYTYLWGTDEVSDSIIVSSAGTYTLTATNQYRCTASTTKSVTVDTLPEITIAGVTSFCYGSSTDLTASGANTYIWNTGSGANSITVSDGGIYSVTGTNDNGCRGTASVMTFVKPLPVPQIVGPSAICQGDTATLSVYGGNTYVWSNNSTQNSINVTQGGTYTVTATSAEQCSATTSFALTVNPLPTITIIGDISFCQDTNTTLTASGASTYVWSNGASGSTITVNTAGAYTVTGTDNNGCTASADKVVTVDTLPVITITGVTSFCYGSSTGLTASGAGTYIWSTGSGTNSITVMDGGMYSVTGTNGNGCRGTASVMTFVKPFPVPQIVGPSEICQGDVATLTAYGGNTYLWSNGSVQNSINVTQSNTYTVTATSSEGCSAIDAFTLTVHSLPNVTIAGESSFCQGSSTILTAGGASTYVWSNGATGSTITVNTAGTYTVTGTDGNGCKNTAPHQLVMNPTYSTSLSDSICQGENYNFFGQNLTESGIYTHTLSSVAGCDSVIILSLTVTPLPIPLITGDNTFCPDEVATLVAGGGTDYVWSTGETTNQIQVGTPDTYTVTVTDAYGCSADASFTVTYAPMSLEQLPIVAKTHADGTPYMLVYPQAGLRYQWYKGGDPIPGETQQYYAPDGGLLLNTSYKVHVAPMDPDSCGLFSDEWTYSGTAASKVRILPNPNNGRFKLLLPEGTVDVQILNANGQVVMARKVDGDELLEMNTGLANGLYFVKSFREDGSFNTDKLIINR